MPTPTDEQQTPGYATLTLDNVNVQSGFSNGIADFTGTFRVDEFDTSVVGIQGPGAMFAIGIHSVDDGPDGVGSGAVGDASSLVGLKILEPGNYTDVQVPIYPVRGLTDVRLLESGPQSFPPSELGEEGVDGEPTVQAAVYDELFFFDGLPMPRATSSPVTVSNGLDQNETRNPLVPDLEGEGEGLVEISELGDSTDDESL